MVPKEHVKDEEITNAIQRFGLFALEGQYQRDITKAGATNKEFKTCKSCMTLRKDIKMYGVRIRCTRNPKPIPPNNVFYEHHEP